MKCNKVIKDRKIRVALAGCGHVSTSHFKAIENKAEFLELLDVCDVDPEALTKAVKKTNAKGHLTIEAMLKSTAADLVVLCTPSGLHSKQAIKIAQSGLHVMVEKPMATNYIDGLEMIEVCQNASVRLFVVKQNRFNSTIQLLKRAIEEKRFGKIFMVSMNVFWTRPQSYYDSAAWRGTKILDGGALMNQASHFIDLLSWLIGPVDDVQAMVSTHRNIEVEDTAIMHLRWRNGVLGSMNVTMLSYPTNLETSITILGEAGSVSIGGVALNKILIWKFDDVRESDNLINAINEDVGTESSIGHTLFYENVIRNLRGESNRHVSGIDGLKAIEIITAAYQSSQENRCISLVEKN